MPNPRAPGSPRRSSPHSLAALLLGGALALSGLAAGCAGPVPEDDEAAVPAGTPGQSFADHQQMLDWLAQQAVAVPLPSARIVKNKAGLVTSVDIDAPEDRAIVAAMMGGADGFFIVGGERVSVAFLQAPGGGARDKAAPVDICNPSGTFCTSNRSWNDHYWIYHAVGAGTGITRGGYTETTYPPFPDPNYNCNSRGCPPRQYLCNPGDVKFDGNRAGQLCRHIEGWSVASVDVAWFSNNEIIGQDSRTSRNSSGVTLERTGFGALVGTCNTPGPDQHVLHQPIECEITGVCASHFAFGGGGSTMTVTGDGTRGVCPFR